MPGPTSTVPSWMTGGPNNAIAMNGISNGTKTTKNKNLSSAAFFQNPVVVSNATTDPDPTPAVDPADADPTGNSTKTQERLVYERDRGAFFNAWTTAGVSVGDVFEDLFRELAGVSGDQISNIWLFLTNLSKKIGADDYNNGVKTWNASIPDRKSALKPLRDPEGNDVGGLNVTIEILEAYPDKIKAALLLLLGIRPTLITFSSLFDDQDFLDENLSGSELTKLDTFATESGLKKFANKREEGENQKLIDAGADQAKDGKGRDKLDSRLTRQLRLAVGLPAVSVG